MAGKRMWNTDLLTTSAGSSAEYVRLFDEITDALTTVCGLVQTEDTGQLDSLSPPVLSTTLGSNNTFGYRIFRFNDAMQAARPIFLKIVLNYVVRNSDTSSRLPYFQLVVGTGSNGAGSITGAGTTVARPYTWAGAAWTALSAMPAGVLPSFACGGEGFAWLSFKVGAVAVTESGSYGYPPKAGVRRPMFILAIMRSTDSDGTPTAEGFVTYYGSPMYQSSSNFYWASPGVQTVSEVNGASGTIQIGDLVVAPLLANFQTSGGAPILCRLPLPFSGLPASPFMGVMGVAATDGDNFEAALVGETPRGYIYPGASLAEAPVAVASTRPWSAPFFIWEGDNK